MDSRTTDRIDVGEVELAVAVAGEPGRSLLLVHGFTGAKEDFADHLDPLAADGWHVVAVDLRGHGESAKPGGRDRYSIDLFADDLGALVKKLAWDSYVLLGHSMGGVIAQEMALRNPAVLAGLVLMDTTYEAVEGLDPETVAGGLAIVAEGGVAALADALAAHPGVLSTPSHQRLLEERPGFAEFGDRKLRASSADMYLEMASAMLSLADRLPDLARLDVPTLVLVGDEDRPFLEPSRRMAAAIPGARLEVLPGGGHSPQFEAPDLWFAALTRFLTEVSPP